MAFLKNSISLPNEQYKYKYKATFCFRKQIIEESVFMSMDFFFVFFKDTINVNLHINGMCGLLNKQPR